MDECISITKKMLSNHQQEEDCSDNPQSKPTSVSSQIPLLDHCFQVTILNHQQSNTFPQLYKTKIPLQSQSYSMSEMIHFLPGALRFLTMSYLPEKVFHGRETPFDFITRSAVVDPRRKGPPIGGI